MRLLLVLFIFLTGCAHQPTVGPNQVQPMSESDYVALMRKHTSRADKYSGFYQTFQADVTILTTEVQSSVLRQKAHFMQWDQKQYQQEREKSLQESNAYAKFFMRFYSPERDYDDLHKGKTIWKVFLEYSGNRFEGKVARASDKMIEVKTLYPNMDRFSTPYELTFNVPMTTIEQGASKIILTSSLGSAEFSFPVGK